MSRLHVEWIEETDAYVLSEEDDDDLLWEELDELPSYEDVLEWQGKGWLWD